MYSWSASVTVARFVRCPPKRSASLRRSSSRSRFVATVDLQSHKSTRNLVRKTGGRTERRHFETPAPHAVTSPPHDCRTLRHRLDPADSRRARGVERAVEPAGGEKRVADRSPRARGGHARGGGGDR